MKSTVSNDPAILALIPTTIGGTEIEAIVIHRDGMSVVDAYEMLAESRQDVAAGADPEEVLADIWGLEPDYIFDLTEV